LIFNFFAKDFSPPPLSSLRNVPHLLGGLK
jgi:hypothetical protein